MPNENDSQIWMADDIRKTLGAPEPCGCVCNKGEHCNGCGHEGCGVKLIEAAVRWYRS
jgi:hypothetical protein